MQLLYKKSPIQLNTDAKCDAFLCLSFGIYIVHRSFERYEKDGKGKLKG